MMESKPLGSYPNSGIDVLVVGTGLAGLTAAIECTRKGHSVQVLERNATINTAGQPYIYTRIIWMFTETTQEICTSWGLVLQNS